MSETPSMAHCRCGQVALEASGRAIVTTDCHCSACQEAGRILQALPGAVPILTGDDGTPFALFRKDRLRCVRGAEHLREHRLKPDSPTRRVVAVCCNTYMFLDFTKGHWVTLARDRFDDAAVLAGAPHQKRQGIGFILRLMATWAAMRFRTPNLDYGKEPLKAP